MDSVTKKALNGAYESAFCHRDGKTFGSRLVRRKVRQNLHVAVTTGNPGDCTPASFAAATAAHNENEAANAVVNPHEYADWEF